MKGNDGDKHLRTVALDIKNIDEHLHVPEDVIPLIGEVVLHEGLLTTAIPEIEGQVAEKSDVRMFDIDCGKNRENCWRMRKQGWERGKRTGGRKPSGVASDVVSENDGSHGGLTRPALAHQQDLNVR